MLREDMDNLPSWPLPESYSLKNYQAGDAVRWAEIETSCGEFARAEDALAKFNRSFPDESKMPGRCFFSIASDGTYCGTATAWSGKPPNSSTQIGQLHWVGVSEEHQRKGLSKALVSAAMHRMAALGETSAFLHTQTWSWVAIGVYLRAGFRPLMTETESKDKMESEARGWDIVYEKLLKTEVRPNHGKNPF